MKRSMLVVLMLLIAVVFTACDNETTPGDLDAEFNRIAGLIPESFASDLTLPEGSPSFVVTYELDNAEVVNRIIEFHAEPDDRQLVLTITISRDELSQEYYLALTQSAVSDTELLFAEVFATLGSVLPGELISNHSLPEFDWENLMVSYDSDCVEVVRNRVVYPFPDNTTTCELEAHVTIDSETRVRAFAFDIVAVDDLPKLPALHITTDGQAEITGNEFYVTGTATLEYDGFLPYPDIVDEPIQIRLRGNSTLYMPKRSYRIKFDEKTRLLSEYAERDWVLLANYTDHTLIRNYLAYQMAGRLDMAFAPMHRFVDVHVNGEYQGTYMISDQIEVSNDRVDIAEHETTIDTGYLIEIDNTLYWRGFEESGDNYFMIGAIPFVIKSPDWDDENYRPEHLTFIQDYMETLLATLEAGDDYDDLIDEASFIDWFLVNEVFKNVDAGYSSIYFYKDAGGKLYMGPVWDLDLSSGNPGHLEADLRGPEGWYVARYERNVLFYYLMQYDSFRDHLKARWNEVYDDVLLAMLDDVFAVSDSITHSRYRNFELWDVIGKNQDWYTAPEIYDLKTYDEQIWFLHDYLATRIAWLNQAINDLD